MSTYQYLENEVEIWARNRGIVQNSTPLAQARKTLEEAGELIEWTTVLNFLQDIQGDSALIQSVRHKVRDCYGDVLVTLIVGAACADVNVTECLEQAYNEIKDRKGYLRADGVFVKEVK